MFVLKKFFISYVACLLSSIPLHELCHFLAFAFIGIPSHFDLILIKGIETHPFFPVEGFLNCLFVGGFGGIGCSLIFFVIWLVLKNVTSRLAVETVMLYQFFYGLFEAVGRNMVSIYGVACILIWICCITYRYEKKINYL